LIKEVEKEYKYQRQNGKNPEEPTAEQGLGFIGGYGTNMVK
jgi:hypothetical protein